MTRSTALILCALLTLPALHQARAQSSPQTFDVTSVKPNTSGEQGGSSRGQPGRYVGTNVTLKRVIGLAYRPVQEFIGGPDWINTERFDIEGKAEGSPSQDQMLGMLRALLTERFKLVVHRETRQLPTYELIRARRDGRLGPALRAAQPCAPGARCGGFSVGNGSLKGTGVTMTQLAAELPSATDGQRVVDRTGLSGNFDVSLTWNADAVAPAPPPSNDPAPSIFAAIQEQLGLKLVATTAPTEVIVIDSAERPSGN